MVAQDLGLSKSQEVSEGGVGGAYDDDGEGQGKVVRALVAARKFVWTSMALWVVGGLAYVVISRLRGRKR